MLVECEAKMDGHDLLNVSALSIVYHQQPKVGIPLYSGSADSCDIILHHLVLNIYI